MEDKLGAEREHGKWFIAHANVGDALSKQTTPGELLDLSFLSTAKFTLKEAPLGHFYADPICRLYDNTYYVFFESFDYRKGKLSYYTIDKNLDSSNICDLSISIPTHTSYPFIFNENNHAYMVPERCHSNNIELYKCSSFPKTWNFVKNIISNVHAGDNTIIKHNNLLWMFTTIYHNKVNYFCIYTSQSIAGHWEPHLKINIGNQVTDGQLTRGAGTPFKLGNRLIRPAQYSGRGINGEGVILYEIKELTQSTYHEIPVGIVGATQLKFLRACHTVEVRDNLFIVDGRLPKDTDPAYVDIQLDTIYETNIT